MYDAHMLANVRGAKEGYARVAALLPEGTRTLLDLGCGTGLELDAVFARFPRMAVTGIDLTREMLDALFAKHGDRALTLICGDYFSVPLGEACFDAALSFETLHHFTHAEKLGLYRRVCGALRPGGVYIEADYMVDTQAEEDALFAERLALVQAHGEPDGFWHFDVPCTVENQMRLLRESGFSVVEVDFKEGNTVVLVARKA